MDHWTVASRHPGFVSIVERALQAHAREAVARFKRKVRK